MGATVKAATVNYTGNPDPPTFSSNYGNGTVINITGGNATFTGDLKNNVVINISGGSAIFSGSLSNNVVFNVSGGNLTVNSIKNNADFNVSAGALNLNEQIGNNSSVTVSGTGTTLNLGTDDVFGSNTNVSLNNGAILDTQGNSVTFDSLTLTGDSTIDLGENPNSTVDVGTITGSGTVTFVGFEDTEQVAFDETGSTINVSDQVLFGDFPGTVDGNGNLVPAVPEPSTYAGGAILLLAGLFHLYRRRK